MSEGDVGSRVDLHVKVLDEAVVRRAKARGLDVLVYAPHFTRLPEIRERAARFSDDDLLVVPGRELFTGSWQNRRHVLAVGLDDPVPDFLTLAGTMAELDRQDAAVLVPHPGFLTVSLTREQIRLYEDRIDCVEVYNPKHLPHHNRRAREIVASLDLAPYASSYAHLRGTIGAAWVTFDEAIPDEDALVEALASSAPRTVRRRRGFDHELQRGLELAHLGYENVWKKADRMLLRGTEPTHPDHVAYGDRFDDVKVY